MCNGNRHAGTEPSPTNRNSDRNFNDRTTCQPGHHQTRLERPVDLSAIVDYMGSHIEALRLTTDDFQATTLDFGDAQREIFRAAATQWELRNSRIVNLASRWMPIVDDANTVVAYASPENRGGVHHLWICDIDGNGLYHRVTGEVGLQDSVGNEIVAIAATIGFGLVVRGIASGLLESLSSAVARGITNASVAVASRLAGEGGERLLLLVLRAMRARAIVRSLQQRGLQVVVNIGGEAGVQEVAEFGANQIALNNQVRMSVSRRFVPNLVKEPGEAIGDIFGPETVDRVVARRLDASFDTNRVAQGAFRVLRRGGTLDMHVYTNDAGFAQRFADALRRAGFRNVSSLHNCRFSATKG